MSIAETLSDETEQRPLAIRVHQASLRDYEELCALFDQLDEIHREARPDMFQPFPPPVRTRELPAAIATAQAFPQARFVLDHTAKPPIADGGSEVWADRIAALGACDNVWCKISGLATEAVWNDWDAERLFPFVAHAARCFGEDRLIFGSDWPVCLLAGSYGEIKSALEACLAKLGPQLRDKAFGVNATRAYRLAIAS